MSEQTTPHPLAVEAGQAIFDAPSMPVFYDTDIEVMGKIIHTTALEPVIKAGEEMAKFAQHSDWCKISPLRCTCGYHKALAQWRTLTSSKKEES